MAKIYILYLKRVKTILESYPRFAAAHTILKPIYGSTPLPPSCLGTRIHPFVKTNTTRIHSVLDQSMAENIQFGAAVFKQKLAYLI